MMNICFMDTGKYNSYTTYKPLQGECWFFDLSRTYRSMYYGAVTI